MRRVALLGLMVSMLSWALPATAAPQTATSHVPSVPRLVGVAYVQPTYLAAADGGVFTFGGNQAPFYGSLANVRLNAPIVSIASPLGGYYLAGADGGVFTFGNVPFFGSLGNTPLDAPIVDIVPTCTPAPVSGFGCPAGGYYLVGADGGVFTFGNAPFYGSLANMRLNAPIVALLPWPDTFGSTPTGYYLVGADGGVFTFGDVPFLGSLADTPLAAPIVGAEAVSACTTCDPAYGSGYDLVGADGGVFNFGDLPFPGSYAQLQLSQPIVAVVGNMELIARDGSMYPLGADAQGPGAFGVLWEKPLNAPIVGASLASSSSPEF